MDTFTSWLRFTELDRTTFPEFVERISLAEQEPLECRPRSYPGYPRWPLPKARSRLWPRLDAVLRRRRCARALGAGFPTSDALGRLLQLSHGITGDRNGGPVPSAGGLQGLELFLVHWHDGWLPPGAYHYDRAGHHLSQVIAGAEREAWRERIPSLGQLSGGALLWVIIGDSRRVCRKYGERGERFLLLEAGHLMQNLCLVSTSLGLTSVPLGGSLEPDVARELRLPETDRVLYTGICGAPIV